jgi:CheY-like chemotaxis protein
MPNSVLFIDDDGFFARPYREELESAGYKPVLFCDNAEDGLALIRTNQEVCIIILDIMMPTPQGVSANETNQSLDTGLWILHQTHDVILKRSLPVLVLTNRAMEIVEEGIRRLEIPAHLINVRQKIKTPAMNLPMYVRQLLSRVRVSSTPRNDAPEPSGSKGG